MKVSGVYKITNTVTGDFYIGSSKDVKQRWASHKKLSVWKNCPNNPMYHDMQKYSVDKFEFGILCEVEPEKLKVAEQQFIEILKPAYNSNNANGLDIDKRKKSQKKYHKSDKYKEYEKTDKRKEYHKEYQKSDKYKEYQKEYQNKYNNQLCSYNGEVLKLCALSKRFQRAGVEHPTAEAKKYLVL